MQNLTKVRREKYNTLKQFLSSKICFFLISCYTVDHMAPAEGGQGKYDAQRALHYHERILQVLKTKAAAGNLHLVTEVPVSGLRILGIEPKLIVVPTQPIHTAVDLDKFRRGLLPGMTPDFQTDSTGSYDDVHGGLHFGSMSFDNIPGFTLYQGRVVEDPHRGSLADHQALERLSKETGKPKTELIKRTWVEVFPEITFAKFMLDYAQGMENDTYPYNPIFFHLASGLSKRQLEALQENPKKLTDWMGRQVEAARNYVGITSNLALAEI